jgi:transcriptional antiterminator RfaH
MTRSPAVSLDAARAAHPDHAVASSVVPHQWYPWYALQTQRRREAIAEASLQRRGVAVFCPRYRCKVILHGYRREVTRPLFPSYLFAAFDYRRDLRAVCYAQGVRRLVAFGAEPAEVPNDLLESIAARMTDGYVRLDPPPLRTGDRVEIVAGLLRGHTGIFQEHLNGAERVAILLDTLKYNARVILDRIAVRSLSGGVSTGRV